MLADVIFSAFTTPYISPFLFPVAGFAAIATEFICYRHFSNDPQRPNLLGITFANLTSWLAGIIIASFLPSGLVEKVLPHNPGNSGHSTLAAGSNFACFAIIAFFIACALSIIIEFWTLQWSTRKHQVNNLFRLSVIANSTGYIVLGIVVWVWVTWIW
jgi:hypothetical protein